MELDEAIELVSELQKKLQNLETEAQALREKMDKIQSFEPGKGCVPTWMRLMLYELVVNGAALSNVDSFIRTVVNIFI